MKMYYNKIINEKWIPWMASNIGQTFPITLLIILKYEEEPTTQLDPSLNQQF